MAKWTVNRPFGHFEDWLLTLTSPTKTDLKVRSESRVSLRLLTNGCKCRHLSLVRSLALSYLTLHAEIEKTKILCVQLIHSVTLRWIQLVLHLMHRCAYEYVIAWCARIYVYVCVCVRVCECMYRYVLYICACSWMIKMDSGHSRMHRACNMRSDSRFDMTFKLDTAHTHINTKDTILQSTHTCTRMFMCNFECAYSHKTRTCWVDFFNSGLICLWILTQSLGIVLLSVKRARVPERESLERTQIRARKKSPTH